MSKKKLASNPINTWDQPGGQEQIRAWIHQTLTTQDVTVTGPIEQIHARPWSMILRIPTQEGNLFFKATAGFAAHEIVLTACLSTITPDAAPQLVAVHPQHPWMIMRDGGQRLREILQTHPDWQHWQNLLPQFAHLQIEAAHHRDRLLDLGLPNRDLDVFPQLYQQWIDDTARFQLGLEHGLSTEEYQRLQDLVPVVEQKAKLLASYAVPVSLHHGDLHDGNIFYHQGQYTFYDWGDASFSHPFFSLRTAYVSAEVRFQLDENAPELDRLRDAYLPAWLEFETEENLRIIFGVAQELWAISSAITWYQVIQALESENQQEYIHVLPSLAKEFLSFIRP
ncbi:MAG: phosphotransferase [Anaerolineae bacterium]|nr:phosphotransferase [Anaerolineae bacterium]